MTGAAGDDRDGRPNRRRETETETGGEGSCSTSGLRLTLPEQDLPAAVADVRKRVFDAAVACDYDTLEEIALEKGAGFTFSYGGSEDASEYWRGVEEDSSEQPKPMRALASILTLPFTRNESGSYAWPTAYSEKPTDEAWQALVDTGLYSPEQDRPDADAGHRLPRLPHRDHRGRRLAVLRRRRLALPIVDANWSGDQTG